MYTTLLALHIIFIVTWFAGLFYIVRLFVYQAETVKKPEEAQRILIPQYQLMSRRLWYGITWPSFVLTFILGPTLLYLNPGLLKMPFMHIKLAFVVALGIYHVTCHFYFKALQENRNTKSGQFYRIWNEVATLFLVAIVFLIIKRDQFNWIYGILGFLLFGITLMIAIRLYKRFRQKGGQE